MHTATAIPVRVHARSVRSPASGSSGSKTSVHYEPSNIARITAIDRDHADADREHERHARRDERLDLGASRARWPASASSS